MEKQSGKDYFGFQGQSENYQKYRPQYPKDFIQTMLSKETLKNLKQQEVAIDIATGTGFLARHMSEVFQRAIGTDVSESQILQAQQSHKDVANLEFKILDVKNLPEFLKEEKLEKNQVDLFTIGQALHWFEDIDGTLKTVNSVLRPDSYFLVFAYTIPQINDGTDWQQKLVSQPEAQGFDVIDGSIQQGYKFEKDPSLHQQLSAAYNEMWKKIYPHFKFNRSVIEKFYCSFNFAEHCNVIRKVIWFDTTPNKSIKAVLGYLESISAYRCYLEDHKIEKGSADDPLEIVRKKYEELGNPDIDFVTPYYCIVLGQKE